MAGPLAGLGWDVLLLLVAAFCVLTCFLLYPYVNIRAFLNRRALRSTFRGGMQYVFGKRGQRRVHGWRLFYRLRVEVMLRSIPSIAGLGALPAARLWIDREAFPRIKKLIRRARHTVVIQMFIWKDDALGREMAEVITEVADRGVSVVVSKEAVGDVFELHKDFIGTKREDDPVWKRFWSHPNIRVHYETHNDHAKVYIIDDRIFLLTGMNIAQEYHDQWHDYLVELHGRPFVEHYLSDGELPGETAEARLVMNTGHHKDIRPAVTALLESARRSIVVEHCYFSDPAILELLIRRSREGVRLVIILSKQKDFHHYANMQSISELLTKGIAKRISVFMYPRVMHAKILLVDRERAFIGSANLMTSSLDEMGEVNVLLDGRSYGAIRKLRESLRDDILISTPLSRPPRFRWLWRWLTWLKL